VVTDFLESRDGDFWIATTDGLARFDPKGVGPSRFRRYALGGKNKLSLSAVREVGSGGIWCGARSGEGIFYLGQKT